MSVPLVDMTARMPMSVAYLASSSKSFRISGSPPENSSTGDPKAARSSIMLLASSVVSSSG